MEHQKTLRRVKSPVIVIAAGVGMAALLAGTFVAFSSGQADARPSYVTKSKPCGSCHPPNKPPKR
jgi:hypothetical protein